MITTVTLNAAVDKAYQIEKMEPHTVMRVRECVATAGGKGLNVARVVAALGYPVSATGFLGGFNGQYVRSLIQGTGITDDFFSVSGETRTCVNVLDDGGGSTEYLEPGLQVNQTDIEAFSAHYRKAIENSTVVTLSGSMPCGCPPDYYKSLIEIAKKAGKQVVLDSSGEALRLGVEALPDLIKPNSDEISALMDGQTGPDAAIKAAMALHQKGIAYVALSQGEKGAVMVCAKGILRAQAPKINAVNTVGCGDAMLGALAVALQQDMQPEEMLAFAVEVSAASAMNAKTGGLSLVDLQSIRGSVVVDREERYI